VGDCTARHFIMARRPKPFSRPSVEHLEPRQLFAAFDVLVFSKTAGFRHTSIDEGIGAIEELGAANDFTVTATEDATAISTSNLAQYEAVVFLSTTGDFLNTAQQAALETYVANGGGWVGIHAAADAEYDWAWYGGLVGAFFDEHPDRQTATVRVTDTDSPFTAGVPATWSRFDEWYNYRTNPRELGVTVLQQVDEETYDGGTMGADHPITWYHSYNGGRAWYTGMGHTEESYADPQFRSLLLKGIQYAATPTAAPQPPVAAIFASTSAGVAPLTVYFSAAGSSSGDNGPATYTWDFDGDGDIDDTGHLEPFHLYETPGTYVAKLTLTDQLGATSDSTVTINVADPNPPPDEPNVKPATVLDSAVTPRGEPVVIDVLANDTDDRNSIDVASVQITSHPAHGAVVVNPATGAVTYTPTSGFTGSDAFEYRVKDTDGLTSESATAFITVTPPATPTATPPVTLELTGGLPASLVSGGKSKAKLLATFRNVGTAPFSDRVTITPYASADGEIDGADGVFPTTTKALRLAPGASKTVAIKLSNVPAMPDGTYNVIARGSGPVLGVTDNANAPEAVVIAAPFRDLAVAFAPPFPSTVKVNSRGVLYLLVRNDGNETAAGTLDLFFSDYQPTGPGFLHFPGNKQPRPKVNFKPGASKVLKVRVIYNEVPSGHRLTGEITPSESVGDANPQNNITETIHFIAG
jgi:type 1 glutamine amidotransferase